MESEVKLDTPVDTPKKVEQGKILEKVPLVVEEVQNLVWNFHQTFNEIVSGNGEWSNLIEKYTTWELKTVIESGTLFEEMVEQLQSALKGYLNL